MSERRRDGAAGSEGLTVARASARDRIPGLVLMGLVCAASLAAPVRLTAGNDGMTVRGEVTVLPAAELVRHPASFFDLEGRTVTFTPDGDGRYAVRIGALTWVETSAGTGPFLEFRPPAVERPDPFDDHFGRAPPAASLRGESIGVSLPFGFPFAGRTWTRVYANTNGNVSFAAPETTHAEQRRPWSNGTMRSVAAAVDSRSAAGLEAMIAVLWAVYGEVALSVDASAERIAITWDAVRPIPRNHYYEPAGPNVFQVRLYSSGVIELAYRQVSERDGIVGLFPGTEARGQVLGAAVDDSGDVPQASVDIVSAELVDNGSTVIASMTMADDIPDRVSAGSLSYYVTLDFDDACRAGLRVEAAGWRPYWSSRCGPAPRVVGYTVQGSTLEIAISKTLRQPEDRAISWRTTAVSRGPVETEWDRLDGQPVTIDESNHDLSSMTETVAGNVFEVFHYPSISKDGRRVMSSIHERAPAENELAAVFTDFRFDDLFNTGPGSGAINVPVLGIGDSAADPDDGSDYGSDSLLSALSGARYIGGPRWIESGVDDGREFHGHSYGVRHVAHELVHRWAAYLRFRDPATGRIEDLTDDSCSCHWSEWLHVPARHPVWSGFSNEPYSTGSVMSGGVWDDNGDGTFTARDTGYPRAMGLSDLDLYAMGMIPPEEVRPTFLLRDVVETGTRGTVRATKVPVRIEDIVAAMGPRVPSASGQRKDFRLGVYLLHEDGRAPRAEWLTRARNLTEDVVEYFTLATGGRADANRPPVVTATLPDRSLTSGGAVDLDVSSAFADPDGDALTFGASSSAPGVATALATGSRVTLTAVAAGTATIRVTATDPGGLSASQSFAVTVGSTVTGAPFIDDPIVPGVTPVRAVHFMELRERIDALRATAGLARFRWTDPMLTTGETRVRLVHLLDLREALAEAYAAAGRAAPAWTDAAPAARATLIRAAHLLELRVAVRELE